MAAVDEILIAINGDNSGFKKALNGVDSGLAGLNRGVDKAMKAVGKAALVGTAAVTGLGVASVKAFATFDDAMTSSLAIMGDVSDAMRKDMSDAAREVGKTTRFAASEAAESYFFLASAGLDASQSLAAMPTVAAFATAGNFDLARATDLVTDAQSAMGLASKDAGENLLNMTRIGDVFVKANTLANASVQQFSEAVIGAAPSAKTLGISLEELTSIMAALADRGIKGAEAGTAVGMMLPQLTAAARSNADVWDSMGVAMFDAEGKFRPMADTLEDIARATEGMTDEQLDATFAMMGIDGRMGRVVKNLLGASDQMRDYEAALHDAGGTMDDVAGKQLESFSAKLDLLKGKVKDVGIGIGESLAPHLDKVRDALDRVDFEKVTASLIAFFGQVVAFTKFLGEAIKGVLRAFQDGMGKDTPNALEASQSAFNGLQAAIEAIMPVVRGVAKAMGQAVAFFQRNPAVLKAVAIGLLALVAVVKILTIATAALNVVLMLNPFTLIVLAIAAVITIIVLLVKHWDWVKEKVAQAWEAMKAAAVTGAKAIMDFLGKWHPLGIIIKNWDAITTWLTGFWTRFKQAVMKGLQAVWDFMVAWHPVLVFIRHWDEIKEATAKALKALGAAIWDALVAYATFWGDAFKRMTQFAQNTWAKVKQFFGEATAFFKGIGDAIFNGIKAGLDRAVQAARDAWERMKEWTKSTLGIASPSKFFRDDIGGNIVKGLEQGLQGVDAVAQRSFQGFGSTAAKTTGATGGGGGGIGSVVFAPTIHAAPGMNAESLARDLFPRFQEFLLRERRRGA